MEPRKLETREKNEKISGPIKNSHKTHEYKKYEDIQNYR